MSGDPEQRPEVPDLLDHGQAVDAKRERQRQLAEALSGGPVPDPAVAEVELDLLADAVVERLVGRLGQEPELEPGFFTGAAAAKQEQRAALIGVLTGRAALPAPGKDVAPSSFDGGARAGELRQPESHGELVVRLAAESRVHRRGF
jgi:hypothetical protein